MKKSILFLLVLVFAIAGFAQELKTEYVATLNTQFGKYMKAPIQVYVNSTGETYILSRDQTRLRTMNNVLSQGPSYYGTVEGLEKLAVVEYDFANGYASDTGTPPRTIYLEGAFNVIPDNAIITEVVMDIISDIDTDDGDGTFYFALPTDGNLTRASITADSTNDGLYFGHPYTYALDGAALTDTLMADSIAGSFIKTTAARPVTFVVSDTMVAGKAKLFIKYVVSE